VYFRIVDYVVIIVILPSAVKAVTVDNQDQDEKRNECEGVFTEVGEIAPAIQVKAVFFVDHFFSLSE
jgi:hypothetical protein